MDGPFPNFDEAKEQAKSDKEDAQGAALFPILTVTQLADLPDPEWLIDDLMVASSLCTLYGLFRSYKSFIALDWGLRLATGTDWCDRTVKQCDVLYIAGEGVGGLKLRVAVWMQHHGITDPIPGFRIIPLAVNLMDKAEAERMILTVTEEQKADGFNPKLVIVDTLHRSMPGADENSARDMGIAISNAALIQRRLGCAMLPVHHCGKDAERGLRGSSGLPGAADTIIRASRTDYRVTLLIEKQKDIEDGQEINLKAQVVNLPRIAGSLKPRSSLVLVPGDRPANTDDGLTKAERAASRFLADLIVAEGKPLPYGGGFPSPVGGQPLLGVATSRWQDECETRHLSTAEATKNRSLTFRRAFQGLLDKKMVAARADLVWLAS
jgi:AAA domain